MLFKDAKTYYILLFLIMQIQCICMQVYVILFMMKISEKINEMKRYDFYFLF